ncbi:alpha/beta hydrolase [Xanthobacter sp. KR7-225]|uniref:alpha/beta fold hydrolase n=1 Tax=Xanthobacter sp. KR7-225 TaxID=3156613 RepID=UPI0032B3416B
MNAPSGLHTATEAVRGYDIHFVDEGRGFPVLLIHGLAGDHTAWAKQISVWRQRHRVIAPDTRGAGRSTQRDEPVTLEDLADDFIALLDRLEIARCHVVGRSMGGSIGQIIALKAPERVHSLALLASCAKFEPIGRRCLDNMREVLEWRGSWAAHAAHSIPNFVSRRFYNANPEMVAAVEAVIASSDRMPATYCRQNHAVQAHDVLDRLGEIACPVLIMSGGEDPLCGPEATRWMVDRLPQAEWVEFEGASHFFFMEEPERFMLCMNDFLSRHTPSA